MKITVAVTLCHALAVGTPSTTCREEVVMESDTMQACLLSQPAVAEWKDKTIFRADEWYVARIKCVIGGYSPREAI
jgi:hypothetical protein